MSPVTAGAGISLGTVALIGGVIVVAGIAYLIYKNNDNKKESEGIVNNLLSDENRHKRDKSIIEDAINEKDWETLEGMFNSKSIKDFPDLIKILEEALKNKR